MTLHPLTRCVVASGGRVSLASGRCAIVPTPKGTPPSFLAYRIGHCAHRLRSLWQVARIPVCEPGRAAHFRIPTRSAGAGQATPRFRGLPFQICEQAFKRRDRTFHFAVVLALKLDETPGSLRLRPRRLSVEWPALPRRRSRMRRQGHSLHSQYPGLCSSAPASAWRPDATPQHYWNHRRSGHRPRRSNDHSRPRAAGAVRQAR